MRGCLTKRRFASSISNSFKETAIPRHVNHGWFIRSSPGIRTIEFNKAHEGNYLNIEMVRALKDWLQYYIDNDQVLIINFHSMSRNGVFSKGFNPTEYRLKSENCAKAVNDLAAAISTFNKVMMPSYCGVLNATAFASMLKISRSIF
jgi:enoyl-CoA hydratase/carnithine racemase